LPIQNIYLTPSGTSLLINDFYVSSAYDILVEGYAVGNVEFPVKGFCSLFLLLLMKDDHRFFFANFFQFRSALTLSLMAIYFLISLIY